VDATTAIPLPMRDGSASRSVKIRFNFLRSTLRKFWDVLAGLQLMKANLISIRIRNRETPATRIFGNPLNELCSCGAQCRCSRFNIGNFKCWQCAAFTFSASNVCDGKRNAIDVVFYPPLSGRAFVF